MMWFWRSSPSFLSNFGMSEGSFVGMGGHVGLFLIGSLVNLARSGKFRLAMYGKLEDGCGVVTGT